MLNPFDEVICTVCAKGTDGCKAVDGVEEKFGLGAHLFAGSQQSRLGDEVGRDGDGSLFVEGVLVDSVAQLCWYVVQRRVVHSRCS